MREDQSGAACSTGGRSPVGSSPRFPHRPRTEPRRGLGSAHRAAARGRSPGAGAVRPTVLTPRSPIIVRSPRGNAMMNSCALASRAATSSSARVQRRACRAANSPRPCRGTNRCPGGRPRSCGARSRDRASRRSWPPIFTLPRLRVEEAQQQPRDRRFARAARPDNADLLAGGDRQRTARRAPRAARPG